jgi:hypothetical protein
MEEENKKITKIVINTEDELTDIVTNILETPNERVLLTFAEESDLLISPINLKVVQETADEQEKLLIAQIIKNPTGVKNANAVGITTIETTALPTDDLWEKEIEKRIERLTPKPVEKVKEVVEEAQKDEEVIKEEVFDETTHKETMEEGITIDEDLPSKKTKETKENVVKEEKENLLAKDFNFLKKKEKDLPTPPKEKLLKNKKKLTPKQKRLLILIGAGVVVLSGLIFFIYYKTAPYVKIKMYIESREATVEKIFVGDENTKEIDFEESKIPIKKETVEKERSQTVKATGTSYKGEKAKGTINIVALDPEECSDETPRTLEAGHTVVSSGGKVFKIDSQVVFKCDKPMQTVGITANDIGEEYNLPQTTSFSIQGYSGTQLKGLASQAITGGSKEQYTILSQVDVNNAVEELKKIAIEEGERELKDKSGGSWEIVGDSIKSDVAKDSIKTDVSVGEEAKETTLNLKTISNATFFMKDGFDDKIAELLTQEAQEKNLFETEKDLELTLGDDVEKEIAVAESTPESTKIKLVAKGFVKPKIEKATVIDAIKGKKWEDGMNALKGFVFSGKETEVVFEPPSFPKKLKYFPTRQGRIFLEFITDAL